MMFEKFKQDYNAGIAKPDTVLLIRYHGFAMLACGICGFGAIWFARQGQYFQGVLYAIAAIAAFIGALSLLRKVSKEVGA